MTTLPTPADWYANPDARAWRTPPMSAQTRRFHRSLPDYAPTPLISLPVIATEVGVGVVVVKDESQRLGLPAFKILGASYAISRALSERLGAVGDALSIDELRSHLGAASAISLVAATDGNHGRAVARVAKLLGIPASIYVPTAVSLAAKDAIRAEGADLLELDVPYDDVVQQAAEASGGDAVLIQDTSWPGYVDVPQWIVDGYDTMLEELDAQVREQGLGRLDLVVVPAGVGSFAQSVVAHYRSTENRPAVLIVEPESAPSVITSLREGQIVPVETTDTVMTGLNCGTVSEIAWPVLSSGVDASTTVTDGEALKAARDLADQAVDSGPCGAATLAGVRKTLADHPRRVALGVGLDSVIALLSTEGHAANPKEL